MKISIIIPVHNSEKYLAETIESAITQTWKEKEIIIVDDGSTDSSLEIAKSFENIKVYQRKNSGLCASRNFGLNVAEGEYIQYLDHDDLLDPDKLEKQMNFILSNKLTKLDIVYSKHINFIDDIHHPLNYDDSHYGKSYDQPLELFNDMLIERTIILPASYLMHRDLIKLAGGWNEQLLNNEDGEFYSRVMTKAQSVHFVPDINIYWRATPNSLSKQVSESYLGFKYQAWTSICTNLLKNNNSERTKYACSQLLYDFIIEFRPENNKWLKSMEKFMKSNDIKYDTTNKSNIHKFVIDVLGWRRTLLLKEKIKNQKFRRKQI